ncbi:MAG: phosphate signaling complex protein PhoU [Calditerrivibrio sp.]|nr:phosphate signaling complex protein PhoU [Calditerrivibrio sp.]MCA1932970.1 phosphate signaling complex protein PhoU [Calditerrivibrio sp.]
MKPLENLLNEIKVLLAEMTDNVTDMISMCIRALVERENDTADKVIDMDEHVDELDNKIEELCLNGLALYEPKAIDLRYIITALRIITDLERVGDHCVDIAKEIIKLNQIPPIKPYIDLPKMADYSSEMVKDAINSFFSKNHKEALKIIRNDDYIDNLNNQILRELLTYIVEDFRKTKGCLSLIFISRSLERIADHATNIAEMVYFMSKGENIRHKNYNDFDGNDDE